MSDAIKPIIFDLKDVRKKAENGDKHGTENEEYYKIVIVCCLFNDIIDSSLSQPKIWR